VLVKSNGIHLNWYNGIFGIGNDVFSRGTYVRIHIVLDAILPYGLLIGRDLFCKKDHDKIRRSGSIMIVE